MLSVFEFMDEQLLAAVFKKLLQFLYRASMKEKSLLEHDVLISLFLGGRLVCGRDHFGMCFTSLANLIS